MMIRNVGHAGSVKKIVAWLSVLFVFETAIPCASIAAAIEDIGGNPSSPKSAVSAVGGLSGQDLSDLAGPLSQLIEGFYGFNSDVPLESFDSERIVDFVAREINRAPGHENESLKVFLGCLLGDQSFAPELAQSLRRLHTQEGSAAAEALENAVRDFGPAIRAERNKIAAMVLKVHALEIPESFDRYSDETAVAKVLASGELRAPRDFSVHSGAEKPSSSARLARSDLSTIKQNAHVETVVGVPIAGEKNSPEFRVVDTDIGDLKMAVDRFEDGEIKIVNLDSEKTGGSHAVISHEVKTPTDFIETLLMLENLRQYGAAAVRLNLSGWSGAADNGLMQLLRSFSDGASILRRDGSRMNLPPAQWNSKAAGRTSSTRVDEVLYIKDRFAGLANEVMSETGRPARRIQVREAGTLGEWAAEIPQGLAGRNVVLIHSNHSDASVTELLLALTALRKAGVGKISVINTYEGYARQDKVFKSGETIAASAMLKAINLLADRHFAFNPHYFDKIQNDQFHGQSIETLNGFFLIAKRMFRQLANELVPGFDSLAAADARLKLGQAVDGRMLMFISPDDGAFGLVKAAAEWFPKWAEKKWGVKLAVLAAHFEKTRSDSKTVKLTDELWDGAGNHLLLEPGQSYPNSFAFIFDDEIARGSTILSSTYKLVRRLGLAWRHVYAGAIQGKFTAGMGAFSSGWTEEDVKSGAATEPKPDRVTEGEKGRMPPRMVIVSNSLKRPVEMANSPVSLAPSIAWAIEQIEKGN